MHTNYLSSKIHLQLDDTIISYDADIIAESISTGLEQQGIPASDIFIKPLGTRARGYRKDVSAYSIKEDDTGRQLLFLHANREGIYDGLPEFIFHHSHAKSSYQHIQAITDEIKRFREEEEAARLFFLPFEQEFFETGRALNRLEKHLDSANPNFGLVSLFAHQWPILNRLPKHTAFAFLRIIPQLASMRNDLPLIAANLSELLQVDIAMHLAPATYTTTNQYTAPPLGAGMLGIDTIIGHVVYDGECDLAVHVRLPYAARMHTTDENLTETGKCSFPICSITDFLPGGSMHGIIEELCGYFIGAEYGIEIHYDCMRADGDAYILEGMVVGMGMRL